MDVKINITPEQVESVIKDAIIKSTIGDQIAVAVKTVLKDWKFKDAVEAAVRSQIMDVTRAIVRDDPEIQSKIKAMVVEKLGDEFIDGVTRRIANAVERGY
jgi:hypothetical protein